MLNIALIVELFPQPVGPVIRMLTGSSFARMMLEIS